MQKWVHMGNGSGRGLKVRAHYPRGLGNGSGSPTHLRVMEMSRYSMVGYICMGCNCGNVADG